jgi:peptide/nickel transport system permease protein
MLLGWLLCPAAGLLAVWAVQHGARGGSAGPWRRGLARLAADRTAMAALFVLVALAAMAILAPVIAPHAPNAQPDPVILKDLPPSREHLFGTDFASRDVFSRVLYGARISLAVASLAVMLSTVLGTAYGAVAGFYGGRVDGVMMRALDAALSIPRILLVMAVVALAQPISVLALILLLGLTGWFGTSRMVRAQVLSLREQDLTIAARALGARDREILWRHLLPNVSSTIIVAATLSLGNVIIVEAALSYLGIGVSPPTPSWGNIIQDGSGQLASAWWMALFPGLAIVTTVLAINTLGDALRDALDPRTADAQ